MVDLWILGFVVKDEILAVVVVVSSSVEQDYMWDIHWVIQQLIF